METDKEPEELLGLGKDRHLCLIVDSPKDNASVSFSTYTLFSLSLPHTHTHTRMIHFADSVIICWWGTTSAAHQRVMCVCNLTVLLFRLGGRTVFDW